MSKALMYIATNEKTGEEYTGTASEVAKKLCVVKTTIYKAQIEGHKVNTHWVIEKEGKRGEKLTWKVPEALLKEWDAITGPVRNRKKEKQA
jgi:hypothetical protein